MWKWKTAAAAGWGVLAVLIATVGFLSSHNSVRPQATIQWVQEVPRRPRSFAVLNPEAFRGSPRLQALYSASLGEDPQSFLQPAPEERKLGLFHSYMPPLRGEKGGSPEYKYSESLLPCPCAGVAGMCLSLFMDGSVDGPDMGPQPCACNCG